MIKKISAILLSLLVVSVLGGCNTIRGVGEDVSSAGGALSRSAE